MPNFSGQYYHNLDQKNRLAVPSKLREELGETFTLFMPMNGDHCLFAYTNEDWQSLVAQTYDSPTSVQLTMHQRLMSYSSITVETDKSGRISIPQSYCEFAHLTREVFILGAGRRVEIWNTEEWTRMLEAAKSSGAFTGFNLPF